MQLLDKRIGYSVGWLGLSWAKQGFNGTIYSVGYPGAAQLMQQLAIQQQQQVPFVLFVQQQKRSLSKMFCCRGFNGTIYYQLAT